jgi:hypothetical protein
MSGTRVTVVVKVLCYKPEGRGVETRRVKLIFSKYLIFSAAIEPGVSIPTNRNEYQKHTGNVSGEKSAAGA